MNKFFFLIIFLFSSINAAPMEWTHSHRFVLDKDELGIVLTNEMAAKWKEKKKFIFRWTQIVKNRVTVLVNNDGHPHQYILYKKRSLDRVKFNLLSDGSSRMADVTYMIFVLSDIDHGKNKVSFDIFIEDKKNRIFVDFSGIKAE